MDIIRLNSKDDKTLLKKMVPRVSTERENDTYKENDILDRSRQ